MIMRCVKSRDTAPEKEVRKIIHQLGYRYRSNSVGIAGNPDILVPALKAAIYVHGCFWHRHKGCKEAAMPSTNISYWAGKFDKNVVRDKENTYRTKKRGWRVFIIWECETRKPDLARNKINRLLSKLAQDSSG